MRLISTLLIALALGSAACGGRGTLEPSDGEADTVDAGPFVPANADEVWRGVGCGLVLPSDQPATVPGTPKGYKHYRVMGTGANLTDTRNPAKAGPRTFWVRVPADYNPNRPYRVVYVLQGCGGYEVANISTYGLFKESSGGTEQAIYVAVDLPEDGANLDCYDNRDGLSSQEWEAFQLIQQVVDANYCTDLNRIYVAGVSTGGIVADMWGCYLSGWPAPARKLAPRYHVRAQVSVMGGEPPVQPTCGGPVAALILHDAQSANPFTGALEALARVGRMNGCDTTVDDPSVQAPWHADTPEIGNVCQRFTGCPAGYPVIFCKTTGEGSGDQSTRVIHAATLFFDELEAQAAANLADAGTDGPSGTVDAATGAPACRPEVPSRCGGVCVDLRSDDANCGACAHACPAESTCGGGACLAAPKVTQHIAPGPSGLCTRLSLAIDGSTLYWAERDTGRIMSVSTRGGPPRVLATDEQQADRIVVRGGRVFWQLWPDLGVPLPIAPAIHTVPAAGGPVTTVFSENGETIWSGGFTVSPDGRTVYLAVRKGIVQVAATGDGATTRVSTDTFSTPATLSVDGKQLVVIGSGFGGSTVDLIDLTGQLPASCTAVDPATNAPAPRVSCSAMVRGAAAPGSSLGIANGRLYWTAYDHVNVGPLPAESNDYAPYSIVTMIGDQIGGMALGASAVFFTAVPGLGGSGGWVGKASLAPDSAPVRIARVPGVGPSIVTDGARVYFTTAACDILSAAP